MDFYAVFATPSPAGHGNQPEVGLLKTRPDTSSATPSPRRPRSPASARAAAPAGAHGLTRGVRRSHQQGSSSTAAGTMSPAAVMDTARSRYTMLTASSEFMPCRSALHTL